MTGLYQYLEIVNVLCLFSTVSACILCGYFAKEKRKIWISYSFFVILLGICFIQMIPMIFNFERYIWRQFIILIFLFSLGALINFALNVFNIRQKILVFLGMIILMIMLKQFLQTDTLLALFTAGSYLFAAAAVWQISMDAETEKENAVNKVMSLLLFSIGLFIVVEIFGFKDFSIKKLTRPQMIYAFFLTSSMGLNTIFHWYLANRIYSAVNDKKTVHLVILPILWLCLFACLAIKSPEYFRKAVVRREQKNIQMQLQACADKLLVIRKHAEDQIKILEKRPDFRERFISADGKGPGSQNRMSDWYYLLNMKGICIEISDPKFRDEMLGTDFSFRHYFQDAVRSGSGFEITDSIQNNPSFYIAKLIKSEKGTPLGVIVIHKNISNDIIRNNSCYFAIITPNGHIVADNKVWFSGRKIVYAQGTHWTADAQKLRQAPEADGLIYAQLPLDELLHEKGWRFTAAIPGEHPRQFSAIIQITIIFIWIICQVLYIFIMVQLNYKNKAKKYARWYRAVFEKNPAGLLVVDSERKIAAINQQALNILGYSREELLEKGIGIIYENRTADQEFASQAYTAIRQYGFYESNLPVFDRDGQMLLLKISGHSISGKDQSGLYSQETVWVFTNETKQIRSEKEALNMKERISALQDYIPEHLFEMDQYGRIISSNNPLIRQKLQRKGNLAADVFYDEKTMSLYLEIIREIQQTGQAISIQHKITFNGKAGESYDTFYPVRHKNGAVTYGCISRDMEKLREITRERS